MMAVGTPIVLIQKITGGVTSTRETMRGRSERNKNKEVMDIQSLPDTSSNISDS